jgi:hypothetical protein
MEQLWNAFHSRPAAPQHPTPITIGPIPEPGGGAFAAHRVTNIKLDGLTYGMFRLDMNERLAIETAVAA